MNCKLASMQDWTQNVMELFGFRWPKQMGTTVASENGRMDRSKKMKDPWKNDCIPINLDVGFFSCDDKGHHIHRVYFYTRTLNAPTGVSVRACGCCWCGCVIYLQFLRWNRHTYKFSVQQRKPSWLNSVCIIFLMRATDFTIQLVVIQMSYASTFRESRHQRAVNHIRA